MKTKTWFRPNGIIALQKVFDDSGKLIRTRAFEGNGKEYNLYQPKDSDIQIGDIYQFAHKDGRAPLLGGDGKYYWPDLEVLGYIEEKDIWLMQGSEQGNGFNTWPISNRFLKAYLKRN